MLNIFYGDMKEAVYNTAAYFKYDYEDNWITDPFVKKMIKDVDQSIVLDSGVIDSPVLGKIPPTGLSGGVKTLILVKFEKNKIFNASTCGDNCAKWLLKIAETEDRTINLRHLKLNRLTSESLTRMKLYIPWKNWYQLQVNLFDGRRIR